MCAGPAGGQETASPSGATAGATGETRAEVENFAPAKDWGDDYQIRTFRGEPFARVTFNSYARALRQDFRNLVYKYRRGSRMNRNVWAIPIRIDLWGDATDVFKDDYLRTDVKVGPDNRFVIQISVRLHDEFDENEFRREVLEALLIEQMLNPLAANPELMTADRIETPAWLVHGFDQLVEHRRGGRPSAFYEGFLESGQMLEPRKIFSLEDPEDLDPVSLAAFRASASALIEALLDQEDGDTALRIMLADLLTVDAGNVDALLRQHFPAFREMDEGLDKWWALQVAALGQQQGYEFLGREETERWLTSALTVVFDGKEAADPPAAKRNLLDRLRRKKPEPAAEEPFQGTVDDYARFLQRPGARDKLAASFASLQRLSRTGFPVYRPVLAGYGEAVQKLMRGETKGLDAEFERLRDLREKIRNTLVQAEDYMNYFEATRAPRRSAAFDDYIEMRQALEEATPPKRNDRISRYMDALESEFR